MKIFDTSYGPDIFGRIRMGLITEMFLTFDGFDKPNVGDQLRISCQFKGVVRDVCTVVIAQMCDCVDEPDTILIQVTAPKKMDVYSKLNFFTLDEKPESFTGCILH